MASKKTYFQKTRKEKSENLKLQRALATYTETQLDPDASSHQKVEAARAEKHCRKQLLTLEATIAARKLDFYREGYLAEAEERFPQSVTKAATDRDAVLLELRNYQSSLEDDPQFDRARNYIAELIKCFEDQVKQEQQEQRDAAKSAEEIQDNLDFLAAERARNEVLKWANPLLTKPMSIKMRAVLQEKCKGEGTKCEATLSSTSADNMDTSGAHMTAIIQAYLDTFKALAARLDIFNYDLTHPPSDQTLKANSEFFNLGCAPENWNFRSTTGKISEEQCRLKLAVERFFNITHQEYRVDSLPNVPMPTVIPNVAPDTLTRSLMFEQAQVQGHDPKALQEQERQARLQRMRIEAPKEFAKLSAEALEPLDLDHDAVAIYQVQTRTADRPNSPARYYFPHGGEAIRGRDFTYNVHQRRWLATPDITVGWTLAPQQSKLSDTELELEAQRAAADRFSDFHSHVYVDAPDSQKRAPVKQQASISPTPFTQAPIEFRIGDHKPPDRDSRTEFRYGSWFTPQQIEEADKAAARSYSAAAPYQDRQRFRMESPTSLYRPEGMGPRTSTVWKEFEAKLKQKSEDQQ